MSRAEVSSKFVPMELHESCTSCLCYLFFSSYSLNQMCGGFLWLAHLKHHLPVVASHLYPIGLFALRVAHSSAAAAAAAAINIL